MSDINIYDVSVGVFTKAAAALINLLKKAMEHPDAATFPSATLIEDMKPLSFHVQSVSNTMTKSMKILKATEEKVFEDNETTMEQLLERAENVLAYLKGIKPEALEGIEDVIVQTKSQRTGKQFILSMGIPSMFFHLQTVYSILRMKGVPLGKDDYMGPWDGPWDRS